MKNGIILFGAMNPDFFYLKMMNSNGFGHKPHENYDVDGLVPTAKSGNDGVMIWGCFVKNKLGL